MSMQVGGTLDTHRDAPSSYMSDADPGRFGGGTLTSQTVEPTLEHYENIFGPSARDIKQDLQRFKRHGRWHLPDILKGPNQYLTDRIDGLITDATNSPFTSRILPYKYITNVDGKIKWNVWSFDEGLSSRVPYESAARTLQQSKRSFAGYTIRQGMAIVLEHNFMMTDAGRANFKNQLNQLIGSIQLTNDLDVHVALVLAPSYQKTMREKYLTNDKSATQICREFVDMFGFVQKNQNALDILIEEAKAMLRTWGAPMPDFMLCNSKLTFQLTMTPDVTNYVANGPEGQKRLKAGPEMMAYRGIGIVHTRAFSMETGAPPRDILRRRVRVAEYYRILPHKDNYKRLFQLYNEERDTWSTFTFHDLLQKALCDKGDDAIMDTSQPGHNNNASLQDVVHAITLGSDASGRVGRHGAAPALGTHVSQAEGGSMTAQLTDLYLQIFDDRVVKQVFWDVQFLGDRLVYVPGTMDFSQEERYRDVKPNKGLFPPFISDALAASKQSYGSAEEKRIAGLKVQSVALYPRDVNQFIQDIKRGVGGQPLADSFNFGDDNLPIPNKASAGTDEGLHVRMAMAVRNFNRYGVPVEIVKGSWRSSKDTWVNAFDSHADTTDANFKHLHQYLRNKGAFYCPNHYKEALEFGGIGNFLGYNLPVTRDFLHEVTMRQENKTMVDNPSWFSGTFLYELVLNSSKHDDFFNDEIVPILKKTQNAIRADETAGKTYSRLHLTQQFQQEITTAITNYRAVGRVHGANYDKDSRAKNDQEIYWLWPNTDKTAEDVFQKPGPTAPDWVNKIHAEDDFKARLEFTTVLARNLLAKGFPHTSAVKLNESIQLGRATGEPNVEDAKSFFHMLAWRLWADQENPLYTVYRHTGNNAWPLPSVYLHHAAGISAPTHFGQGVMVYGTNPPPMSFAGSAAAAEMAISKATEDIEVVIVRPNIEHHMLGIILGQGGESLGSTFWGQTELSCYDDSQHGIWGMSYKYNERAIVINERNLVRLWDVAYDGYVGGKEDSSVDWNSADVDNPHSLTSFVEATMDVTKPYRGPSMMVMAFNHVHARHHGGGGVNMQNTFKENFKSNWPSPIVYYDRGDNGSASTSADFDNIHVVEVDQFRVFKNNLYKNAYKPYFKKMPDFWDLHKIRKNAGTAAVENEAQSDALAFQGTMRTLSSENGGVIQEIQGSGHHGPDFIGCASLRAGKGYKINSQPTIQRII
jgi:hypothetical protein